MTPALTSFALLALATVAWKVLPATASTTATAPATPASTPAPPAQTGPVLFTGQLDRDSVMVGSDGQVRLELVMESPVTPEVTARVPTDLVVVMDHSSSMSGEKMSQALAATRALVGHLQPEDRFALVDYASGASVAIPLEAATPANQARWAGVIDGVRAGGSTNISAALDRALALVGERSPDRSARAVLISDGLPTMGDTTPEGLRQRARSFAAAEVPLTAAGVGADFDEFLMTSLADAGTGNYHYLASAHGLADVFADEFDTARETVASGLELTLKTAPGVEVVDAAGYPLARDADATRVAIGALYAGQRRSIWVTLRAPTDAEGELSLGEVALAYRAEGAAGEVGLNDPLALARVADEDRWVAGVDAEAWGRAVITEEYSALKTAVSKQVKAGDRAAAVAAIDDYRARNYALNQKIGSAAVTGNLDELGALEAQVDETFEGEGQAMKQAEFSKIQTQSGYYGRRGGQAKGK